MLGPRMLKIVSLSLSLVGRIPEGGVPLSRRLRNFPEMTRTVPMLRGLILDGRGLRHVLSGIRSRYVWSHVEFYCERGSGPGCTFKG